MGMTPIKTLLLALSLFTALSVSAQHHLGLVIQGERNYRDLSAASQILEPAKEVRDADEHFSTGYQVGLTYRYALNERFSLVSGLRYTRRAYQTEERRLQWASQHNDTGGINPTLPGEGDFGIKNYYRYDFLELPMGIDYAFGRGKLRPFIAAEVTPAYHFRASSYAHTSPSSPLDMVSRDEVSNPVHLFIGASAGGRLALSKATQLSLAVSAARDLINLNGDQLPEKLYGMGVRLGLEREF